jgi:hypothetical protein
MRRCRLIVFSLLSCFLITISCIDEFNRGTETVYYNPSFSIPIGPLSYSLQEIMPYAALGVPIPDSVISSDSILGPVLVYDDSLFFDNPQEGYDTSFVVPIDFRSLSNQWEYVRSLMFRVNTSNGIPVNIATQLYFMDAGNFLLDSLYTEGKIWIATADVDNQGIVTTPYTSTTDFYIDSFRIDRVLSATQIRVYIFLETLNEHIDTLRVYSYYQFDLQLALRAELMIPLN